MKSSAASTSDLTDRIGTITPPTPEQVRAATRFAIETAERDGWDASEVLAMLEQEGES